MKYHILHRTGRVYSTFFGDIDAAQAEVDRQNKWDDGGTTTIDASFNDEEKCLEEFYRLIGA